MSHKLINLLPDDRIKALRRDYFVRLGTVAVLLLTLLTVIHGIFLFPSYLSLSGKRAAKTAELAHLTANIAGSKESELNSRLMALKGDSTYLAQLGSAPSASTAVRAVLAVPRTDIHLSGISFAPSSGSDANGKMTISGSATTREALRAYNLALSQLPFVSAVDLPISSYAQETNISFSMTLTGTLKP